MKELQESVKDIHDVLKNFVGEFTSWRQSVESRLSLAPTSISSTSLNPSQPHSYAGTSGLEPMGGQTISGNRRINDETNIVSPPRSRSWSTMDPVKQEEMSAPLQQPASQNERVRSELSGAIGRPLKRESGLQSDHTAPTHKLFEQWVSMADFCRDVDYIEKLVETGHDVSDYPMLLERDRGLLRTWGIGEGHDLNDGAQGPGSPDDGGDLDISSPAPEQIRLWGFPPADASNFTVSREGSAGHSKGNHGNLGPDGRPGFCSAVLWELHDSYIENIHRMHPFLNASELRGMVRAFSAQYSPDFNSEHAEAPAAKLLGLHQSLKRKQSGTAFGERRSSKGAIERSLPNALVLLVLALGEVCAHHDPLPSPQSDKMSNKNGGWGVYANGRVDSGTNDNRPRNVDILPGMGYFAYATDILGNQQGGNTISHAQAFLLVGLYLSQFARVLESWSWIYNACRIVLVLVKANYQKLNKHWRLENSPSLPRKERRRLDLLTCAYWSCLQLESDILAEMSTLPPSSISELQSEIVYPDGVYEIVPVTSGTSVEERIRADMRESSTLAYHCQIWLYVIANETQNMLYGKSQSHSVLLDS